MLHYSSSISKIIFNKVFLFKRYMANPQQLIEMDLMKILYITFNLLCTKTDLVLFFCEAFVLSRFIKNS